MEATALDHRGPGRHGTGRLRRHHRQPSVPGRPQDHRRDGDQHPRLVRRNCGTGRGGRADLVAFFFLRAFSLLTPQGNLGLIATNTIAQGDTREVGLDQMVADGFTITRAIQSRSWPVASANLEYAAVWGTRGVLAPASPRVSDDVPVQRISTLLESAGRVEGHPSSLAENLGIAFQGCIRRRNGIPPGAKGSASLD